MKTCTKCNKLKPFSEFVKSKHNKGGYYPSCKECKNKQGKKYRQANKEKLAENNKDYYQRNKENVNEKQKKHYYLNKDKIYERSLKYRRTNKEKVNEWAKNYRQDNKEKVAETVKKSRLNNIEKAIERERRYRQSEQGRLTDYKSRLKRRSYKHKVSFTPHDRKEILDRDNWTCQCCGIKVHDNSIGEWNTPDKAHIDHIIPISKGGNSELNNLRVLCRTCNLVKNDKQDEQLNLFN
jgi:5-methylcytosine-specific restriction endonuclease McrA